MLRLILHFDHEARRALDQEADLQELLALPVRERIARMRYVTEDESPANFEKVEEEISQQMKEAVARGGEEIA